MQALSALLLLHRAALRPARHLRAAARSRDCVAEGHHRRGRRQLLLLRSRPRSRLSRRLVQVLQGLLQGPAERHPRRGLERRCRRGPLPRLGRGSHLPARPRRPTGFRPSSPPSGWAMWNATATTMSTASARRRGRGRSVPRRASRALHRVGPRQARGRLRSPRPLLVDRPGFASGVSRTGPPSIPSATIPLQGQPA